MEIISSMIGVQLDLTEEKTVVLYEGDLVENLSYTEKGETVTVTGKVRVIKCRIKVATAPSECPPEPYMQEFITPTEMILDVSQEDNAEFKTIKFENIIDVEKINNKNEVEKMVDTIIETLPNVKVTLEENNVYQIITSTGLLSDTALFASIMDTNRISHITVTSGTKVAEYGENIDTTLEMFNQFVDEMIPKTNDDPMVTLTMTVEEK